MAEGLNSLDPLMLEALGLELNQDADPALLAAAAHGVERDRQELQRRRQELKRLQNPVQRDGSPEESEDQPTELKKEVAKPASAETPPSFASKAESTEQGKGDGAQPPQPLETPPVPTQESSEMANKEVSPEVVQILEQLGIRVEQLPSGNGAFNFINGDNNQQAAVIINQGVQAKDLADLFKQVLQTPVFAGNTGQAGGFYPTPNPVGPAGGIQPGGFRSESAPQSSPAPVASPASPEVTQENQVANPKASTETQPVPTESTDGQEPAASDQAETPTVTPVASTDRQPEVRIIGSPESQEDYERLTIDYFNRLAQQTERNFSDRQGRGISGAIRRMGSWFSRVGSRQEGQTLDEAGRYIQNASKWRKWAKIGLKVLGGAGLAAATVLSGGAAGSLAAFKLLGVSLAPAAYTIGLKTGIDGLMESYQQLKWGNERINQQLDKQVEVSAAMDRLRNDVREGRINQASFANHVREIWRLHGETQTKENEYWTEQQKARQKRLWGSSAAAFGLAFLGGIPVGVGGEGTPPYKGSPGFTGKIPGFDRLSPDLQAAFAEKGNVVHSILTADQHGVVYKPLKNIINGNVTSWDKFMNGEFFYNTTGTEYADALRVASEKGLLLKENSGFWGLQTHSLGHGLGLAERKGLLSALISLVGLNAVPGLRESSGLSAVEERAERQAERALPDRYIEPNETPSSQTTPSPNGSTPDQNPTAPVNSTPPTPDQQPERRRRGLWQRFLDLFRRNPENR